MSLACSVLEGGIRVFSTRGVGRAFGSRKTGAEKNPSDDGAPRIPAFLTSSRIFPFLSNELIVRLQSPLVFRPLHGGRTAFGYEVTILPKICEALIDARKAGKLSDRQVMFAEVADVMFRAFANVGIVALVDEATGYQEDRTRDELQIILSKYIAEELRPWVKTFPDEFLKQVYRLHGWKYEPGNTQGPRYVGLFIDRYIYKPLPPGVREQLRERNPSVNGQRKHKHFQLLSQETGNQHLDKQIVAVITAMKLSSNKKDFARKFKKLFGTQLSLPHTDDADDDDDE